MLDPLPGSSLIITPAYGRDYMGATDAIADWESGKDFQIQDISCPNMGGYCSIRDAEAMKADGYTSVKIRFNKLAEVVVYDL